MKILYVLETNVKSRQAVAVLEAFAGEGAEIGFVSLLGRGDLHDALDEAGMPAHALGIESKYDWPRAVRRLAAIIRSEKPDVIHCVEPVSAVIGASAAGLARHGLRVFHRQHSTARWPQTFFARAANKSCELLIACSDFAGQACLDEGVPPEKLTVVHNGVPAPRAVGAPEIAELRRSLAIDDDSHIISTVARLRPEKGIQIAIDALETVQGRLDAGVVFVVAGSGPYEQELHELAASSSADVRFVGHQSDVAPWFSVADLVVMPSLFDAAPLASAEAMACGKPILASATGGLLEYVDDGTTGMLVPPGEAGALADGIADLLGSPGTLEAYGRAARERFDARFSVERMAAGCIEAERAALARR